MGNNTYILTATRANFDQLVVDNSRRGLVLVDFWSPKAGPSLRQREILTQLAQQPDDHQTRYRLASVLRVRDDYESAMEQLMTLQRTAPDFRDGIARKGLLALFNMLNAGDERVKRFRAELFNLRH